MIDRIEAAARVLFERSNYGNGLTWDDTDSLGHDSYMAWARAVLAAADTADRADIDTPGGDTDGSASS